jgi:tetrahydromethanopterin S-methyltransferase subunit F
VPSGRCVNCRLEIAVPDTYAHGDHVKCGSCGTRHKVQRGEGVRLVLADVAPLKDAVRANEQLIARLEEDLHGVRSSFGIGANGIIVGVLYAGWLVAFKQQMLGIDLLQSALLVAAGTAVALEAANFLFLSKRRRISRLAAEIDEAQEEGRRLQQKIREAGRV